MHRTEFIFYMSFECVEAYPSYAKLSNIINYLFFLKDKTEYAEKYMFGY